ncbi:MAG: EAL domain-containing protein [Rhodocyclaceae bacterium]|nr:EAL domain-containing protein [Rhodocyclaceae bacterium]
MKTRTYDELERIVGERRLEFVFQPIVDVVRSEIYGFEALMRGPEHSPLRAPDALLSAARQAGLLVELERCAVLGAVRAFGALGLSGKLFLNASAPAVHGLAVDRGNVLFGTAVAAGVAPSRLMIELTEHERVEDTDALQEALTVFTTQDIGIALDDFGDGRSSLRLWAQLQPDIVKLDKYFTRDVHRDNRKVIILRTMLALAERFGSLLVAEGIENPAELAVLRDLGCRYAQGYLLGRPAAMPSEVIPQSVQEIFRSSKIAVLPSAPPRRDSEETVRRLLVAAEAVSPAHSVDDVRQFFGLHEALHAVAVVEDGYPVGLINRRSFLEQFAQPYYRELFGRRSCATLMNPAAFRVDLSVQIESLTAMLAGEDQRYLFDGFIVTDGGRYAGLATGESLVKAVTECRIEAARHANPLTFLPGNIPITEHIRRLLDARVQFAACYFDLNSFKPFNDLYGYWRGDEMIKLAAAVIQSGADPSQDFVGHVGGDDFVVLFQSDDWMQRCRRIVGDFNLRAKALFDAEDLQQNGFTSEDRQGFRVLFPLTTIVVGAVHVEPGAYEAPEAVASAAAAAKKLAKKSADGVHVRVAAVPWCLEGEPASRVPALAQSAGNNRAVC